jgi:hypothetical protein
MIYVDGYEMNIHYFNEAVSFYTPFGIMPYGNGSIFMALIKEMGLFCVLQKGS